VKAAKEEENDADSEGDDSSSGVWDFLVLVAFVATV
jgi:hypothetical protein